MPQRWGSAIYYGLQVILQPNLAIRIRICAPFLRYDLRGYVIDCDNDSCGYRPLELELYDLSRASFISPIRVENVKKNSSVRVCKGV